MIVEAIQWLASKVNGWTIGVLDRRRERRMLKAFPVGCRVRFLRACDCGQVAISDGMGALNGIVEGLSSDAFDYRVHVDGTDERAFTFMCSKGMERV